MHESDFQSRAQHRISAFSSPRCAGRDVRVSDELNVDLAPDGSVYGIELLNANERLRAADNGQVILVGVDGREVELSLEAQ
jgi:uncharacterized protein YuzE